MLLSPERSICEPDQKIIVSQDKGTSRRHRADNSAKRYMVRHYKLDGEIVTQSKCCDFLLLNDSLKRAYFIELKGGNVADAVWQLKAGYELCKKELAGYEYQFRIVSSKVRTHEIQKTAFRKFQDQWGSRLQYKTNSMEEAL